MKEFLSKVAVPILAWRIMILCIMVLGFHLLPVEYDFPFLHQGHILVESMTHWDGMAYMYIVHQGYGGAGAVASSDVAYFPLFPILLKLGTMLGLYVVHAGFLINLLCTLGSAFFLTKLAERFLPASKAHRVLWLFVSFPTAFYLGVLYAEALYCFLALGAFYYYFQRKPWAVALFSLLAAVTRVPGLIVGVTLVIGYLLKKQWKQAALVALVSPLGILAFMYYLYLHFGDPLAFITIHKTYFITEQSTLNLPYTLYRWWIEAFHAGSFYDTLRFTTDLFAFVFATVVTVLGAKKLPRVFTIFSTLTLLALVYGDGLNSMPRYILPLFPMYLTLALYQPKEMNRIWLIGSAMMMGAGALLFSAYYWVS